MMRGGSREILDPANSADRQIRSREGQEKNHGSKKDVDDGKCHNIKNGGFWN
jgi:hypothetical protein